MTAPVAIQGVNHRFGAHHVLKDVALEIGAGEYVALLGPSGCGKTTLLSVIGGFVLPDAGRILIGGADMTRVPPAKRPTTTVFQDYALFPHMSLRDNVGFGLRMAGIGRAERDGVAETMLTLVGLSGAAEKHPEALSGGQRQRVALARALAVKPDVLLLDEPLGALDLALRRAMQDELKAIQRQVGTTFVHVTHDQEEAMAIADRIVVMNAGRIEDAGAPERIYRQPATLFAASFMGEITKLPGRASGDRVETPLGALPLPLSLAPPIAATGSGPLVVCIRPEAVRVARAGDALLGEASVADAAFFGTHWRAQLIFEAAPETSLLAYLPPDTGVSEGQRLTVSVDPGAITVFEER